MASDLDARMIAIVRRIPRGRVLGYRDVAALAGNALAARQAGRAMRDAPAGVPWWRVVASDGSVRTGARGIAKLRAEGVTFHASGERVRMEQHRWAGPTAPASPLRPRRRARPPR